MPDEKDVVRLPETNPIVGYCPDCGATIRETDKKYGDLYECIRCRICHLPENMIPF